MNNIRCLLLCLGCLVTISCNKILDVEPNHVAAEEQQWQKIEDARAALMGIYGLTRAALAENNTHWVCGDLRLGDFSVTGRNDLREVANNALNKPNGLIGGVSNWRRFYAAINAAAVFIERAPQIVGRDRSYSEVNLGYDIAQARALRAFNYFYLVRIWGDVPLITQSYDNGSFPAMGRTASQTVLNYARGELLEVLPALPFGFGTEENLYYGQVANDWYGTLFNKLSAYALLAHIAAWEGNYADAETYTKYILDNAGEVDATLLDIDQLTLPDGLFSSASNNPVKGSRLISFNFPFGSRGAEATQSGHLEQWTLAQPFTQRVRPDIYLRKDSLYSIFSDLNDLRFGIDTATQLYRTSYIHNMNADIPMFSKINVIQNGSPVNGDYAVFGSAIVFTRLEEISLLRAEALVALNRGAEAMVPYNDVRLIRGLYEQSYKKDFGGDDKRLLAAIFEERRRELMGEGWRWYDQVRRQKLLNDDPEFLQLIRNGGIYWPIAVEVRSRNPEIDQTTYWQ